MNRQILSLATFCVFSIPVASGQSPSDETSEKEANSTDQSEMARLQELANPGKEHLELGALTGSWSVQMSAAGKKQPIVGKAEASMILGKRFLVIDSEPPSPESRFAFRYTIGFDRRNNEYVITLLDSSGTYPVHARGKKSGNTIRMFGTDDDPMMKRMGYGLKRFAFDLEIAGSDSFTVTTIFIDTRGEKDKLIPAFSYEFSRRK